MEDIVLIALVMMTGVFALVGMRMFKPNDNRKQAKKDVQDTAQKEVISSKDITITTLKDELRSITGKLTRMRDKVPDEEVEATPTPAISGAKEASWEEIQELVKVSYPQYAKFLALPTIKEKVMEQVKGMSLAQIIQQIQSIMGGGQPQSGTAQTNEAYNPNFA